MKKENMIAIVIGAILVSVLFFRGQKENREAVRMCHDYGQMTEQESRFIDKCYIKDAETGKWRKHHIGM